MSPAELARYRQRLLALKAELLTEGDVAIEPARKDAAEVGGDEDEQPLTEMNQVIASKRNRSRTDVLARVMAALKRMDDAPDEYGACAECGEPIGRRLEAMPYVELCVECQQEQDGGERPTGRRRHVTDYK
jgi:DnaK suppressor protein